MGTLYDLLGALPNDDADALRAAFRKAAKATHPDLNPGNPEAALRFRELMRAHDILTDAEQRATYDQLLAIALQPPVAKTTSTYEVVGRFASNTMAATIISAVLVGGYVLLGLFSKPPGAAEIPTDGTVGRAYGIAAAAPDAIARNDARMQHAGEASAGVAIEADSRTGAIGRFDPLAGFAAYHLAIQAAYFDRGSVFYRTGDLDRRFTAFTPVKRVSDSRKNKNATPAPPRPLSILARLPERRKPIPPALTP